MRGFCLVQLCDIALALVQFLKLLKAGAVSEERDSQHCRRLALVEFLTKQTRFDYIAATTLAVRTSVSNR
jgi:hypothetical protein